MCSCKLIVNFVFTCDDTWLQMIVIFGSLAFDFLRFTCFSDFSGIFKSYIYIYINDFNICPSIFTFSHRNPSTFWLKKHRFTSFGGPSTSQDSLSISSGPVGICVYPTPHKVVYTTSPARTTALKSWWFFLIPEKRALFSWGRCGIFLVARLDSHDED